MKLITYIAMMLIAMLSVPFAVLWMGLTMAAGVGARMFDKIRI